VACNIGAGLICANLDELGGAMQTSLDEHRRLDMARWGREGMNNLTPLWLLKYLPNMLACHVTIIHGLKGPSNTITCGEASALLAIAEAASQIFRGDADAAIAGGAETKLNPMGLLRQGKLGRLTTANESPASVCRPFDVAHAGTVLGEGAGLLVLEEAQAAVARGARIYAELVGFGAAADPAGCDPLAQHCGNLHLACRRAMDEAQITAADVDLVIAHGTGVPHEDRLEAARLAELLPAASGNAEVLSITGAIGNTYAAAGALGAAVAAAAIGEQKAPASVNFAASDAGCAGIRISPRSHARKLRYVLVETFSHAGQSAAAVLKAFEGGQA
jgi:3-oxoacyl-[acyl-carrier-protein] synthase II